MATPALDKNHWHGVWTLSCLVLSLLFLLPNSYESPSFERPIHLTILSLLLCSLIVRGYVQWSSPHRLLSDPQHQQRSGRYHQLTSHDGVFQGIGKPFVWFYQAALNLLPEKSVYLVGLIVARAALMWLITSVSQCTWSGIKGLLPLIVLAVDSLPRKETHLLGSVPASTRRYALLYATCVGLCSFAMFLGFEKSHASTGTVCPVTILGAATPFLQMMLLAIDALILFSLSRIRNDSVQDGIATFDIFSQTFLVAAISIFLLSLPSWRTAADFSFATHLQVFDIGSLLINSLAVSAAGLSTIALLGSFSPIAIALLVSSMAFFRITIFTRLLLPPLSVNTVAAAVLIAALLLLATCYLTPEPRVSEQSAVKSQLQNDLHQAYVGFIVAGLIWWTISPPPNINTGLEDGVQKLIMAGETEANSWAKQASASTNLKEAVDEYKKRYGILPPPNFDKWYAFAVEHDSPVVDSFDQIHEDLLPFWAISPKDLRERTKYLMSDAELGMGSMRIRNGQIDQSPHIPGTHRWMADGWQKMMEPFAKWLPDMDVALNLGDECRMVVPFEDMRTIYEEANLARQNHRSGTEVQTSFTNPSKGTQWPEKYPEMVRLPPNEAYSTNYDQKQIYYDLVAPSCPPNSSARNSRWWDWTTTCPHCIMPHAIFTKTGPLLADATAAHDLCHQPDLAYLNGLLYSPATVVGTNKLLPVFSQARAGGFRDILLPSPWDFNKKSEYVKESAIKWSDKFNALYWRGAPTDGFAGHGRWPGFLRARFVNEAHQHAKLLLRHRRVSEQAPLPVNVSFVGNIPKCDPGDCEAEQATFSLWGQAVVAPGASSPAKGQLPPPLPFNEHWRYRHLIDMDGAGFSGRFLPFLQSYSLVYRATVFRTWLDERVQAWHHYVPVDVRLGHSFWPVLDFFSAGATSISEGKPSKEAAQLAESMGHKIAEQGREWAYKALRPEDMQIYTFRLMLEWARLVDDKRESLGFVIT